MGKFACYCGYLISDVVYPCPAVGELRWQTESEPQSQKIAEDVAEFLESIKKGFGKEWIQNYFDEEYAQMYPTNLSVAEVIDDIYSKVSSENGHCVYKCPECERLYLQKQFYTDEWICYEKASSPNR